MNKTKKILLVGLVGLLLGGCASKNTPLMGNGEDPVATLKDDKKVTVNELYNGLKEEYGLSVLINKIDKIILEDKYASEKDAANSYTNNMIDQYKQAYGDQYDQVVAQYYGSEDKLKERIYLNYFQQKAINDYAKTKITDSDIKKYYKNEVKPDIKLSHILITVDAASDASAEDKATAENTAKAKAKEIIEKLKNSDNVSDKFKELVKEYSKDDSTKNDDGNLGFVNVDTLGTNYKELIEAAYKLKDNEYSKEPIKTTYGYHVILRTETKEKASLDELKDSIIETLTTNYVNDNAEVSIKAMQALRDEYNMNITDSDLHTNYSNYIRNSLEQIKQQSQSN